MIFTETAEEGKLLGHADGEKFCPFTKGWCRKDCIMYTEPFTSYAMHSDPKKNFIVTPSRCKMANS